MGRNWVLLQKACKDTSIYSFDYRYSEQIMYILLYLIIVHVCTYIPIYLEKTSNCALRCTKTK